MKFSSTSSSRSVGSEGRSFCLCLFATLARFSGFGIAGIGVVGVLSVCSSRTLFTISAADVNISLEVVSFTKALTSVAMLVQQRGRFVWGCFD